MMEEDTSGSSPVESPEVVAQREEFRRSRIAIYRGAPTACPSDVEGDYQWPYVSLPESVPFTSTNVLAVTADMLRVSDHDPLTLDSPSKGSTPSPAKSDAPLSPSRSAVVALNTLNVEHTDEIVARYLDGQQTRMEAEDDWSEDIAMTVTYSSAAPHQAPPPHIQQELTWNERFAKLVESPEGTSRSEALDALVREFCEAAVPVARHILSNAGALLSSHGDILHREGITYELAGGCMDACDFINEASVRDKLNHREYLARLMLQQQVPQGIFVPFTILVESLGCSVLCYPQLPISRYYSAFGAELLSPRDEHADGFGFGESASFRGGPNKSLRRYKSRIASIAAMRSLRARSMAGLKGAGSPGAEDDINAGSIIPGMSLMLQSSMLASAINPHDKEVTTDSELVYGAGNASLVHASGVKRADPETAFTVQTLCERLHLRGHWVGPTTKERKYISGAAGTQFYRSVHDNRVYGVDLKWWLPPAVVPDIPGQDSDPDGRRALRDALRDSITREAQPAEEAAAASVALGSSASKSRTMLSSTVKEASLAASSSAGGEHEHLCLRLRPEFLLKHANGLSLNPDATLPISVVQRAAMLDDLRAAIRTLTTYVIPQAAKQFVRDLRNCAFPSDLFAAGGVSHFMHHWGINMRFLPAFRRAVETCSPPPTERGLAALEIEMAARAVKTVAVEDSRRADGHHLVCDRALVENHLRALVGGMTPDTWKTVIAPAVERKYGADVAPVSAGRVGAEALLRRLSHLMGYVIVLQGRPATSEDVVEHVRKTRAVNDVAFSFRPRVRCPPTPSAPYHTGYEAHSIAAAKRQLRLATATDFQGNQAPLAKRLITFLQDHGQGTCEEAQLAFVALTEASKRRRGKDKAAQEHAAASRHDGHVMRKVRSDGTTKPFSVTKEALEPFGVTCGQRLYLTSGKYAGVECTVIGVRSGCVYVERLVSGSMWDEGCEELPGESLDELTATHGLWLIDARLAMLQSKLKLYKKMAAPVLKPLTIRTMNGYLVLETDSAATSAQFGFSGGDRLQFRKGPRTGQVTTVLGLGADSLLWHQVDGVSAPEAFRHPDREALVAAYDFLVFERGTALQGAPIDTFVAYSDGRRMISGGFRMTSSFNFVTDEVVKLTKGAWAGELAVIRGAYGSGLGVMVLREDVDQPVDLGASNVMIEKRHAPRRVGVLRQPVPSEPTNAGTRLLDDGVAEPVTVTTSSAACLAAGFMLGQRVRIIYGINAGCVCTVVGARKRELWCRVEVDERGRETDEQSAATRHVRCLAEDLLALRCSVVAELEAMGEVPSDWEPNAPVASLTAFGEVVEVEGDPLAANPFGYYHGQRLAVAGAAVAKWWPAHISLEGREIPAEVDVVVIGVFRGELWFMTAFSPFVLPFAGCDWWSIFTRYHPAVRGMEPVAPFTDLFAGPRPPLITRRFDEQPNDDQKPPGTDRSSADQPMYSQSALEPWYFPHQCRRFVLSDGQFIGLDTSDEAVKQASAGRYSAGGKAQFVTNMRTWTDVETGAVMHEPEGPVVSVCGAYGGQVHVLGDIDVDGGNNAVRSECASIGGFRVVTPLPTYRFDLWRPCQPGHPALEPPPRSDAPTDGLVPPKHLSFAARARGQTGVSSPPAAAVAPAGVWGYLGIADAFVPFPTDVAAMIMRGVAAGKRKVFEGEAVFDLVEMMYEPSAAVPARKLRCVSVHTVEQRLWQCLGINLRPIAPRVIAEVCYRAHDALRVLRGREAKPLSTVVTLGDAEVDGYPEEDMQCLDDACAMAHDSLQADVRRDVRTVVSDGARRNLRLRLDPYGPTANRVLVLREALACFGLTPRRGTSEDELAEALLVLEARVGYVDLPSEQEFRGIMVSKLVALVEEEHAERSAIVDEEHALWRRGVPSAPVAAPRELLEVPASDGESLRRQSMETGGDADQADRVPGELYTFASGVTCVLQPSAPSAKVCISRGSVIEYTRGDLKGTRAVILGSTSTGTVVRRELDGVDTHSAMTFESLDDAVETYGIEAVPEHEAKVDSVPASDDVLWYTWDGHSLVLDSSFEACEKFGVLAGERLVRKKADWLGASTVTLLGALGAVDERATSPASGTSEQRSTTDDDAAHRAKKQAAEAVVWPFPPAAVIVILGVGKTDGRLWFAIDQTGAIPFPPLHGKVTDQYGLSRIAAGPLRLPQPHPAYLFRYYGLLSAEEAAFLETSRSVSVFYNLHPSAMGAFGMPRHQAKLVCTRGVFQGSRLSVIGVRHGQLWVAREGEGAARPLPQPMSSHGFKPALSDSGPRIASLPLPAGPQSSQRGSVDPSPTSAADAAMKRTARGDAILPPTFRYMTHVGLIGLFDATSRCESVFGVKHNALITCVVIDGSGDHGTMSRRKSAARRKSTVPFRKKTSQQTLLATKAGGGAKRDPMSAPVRKVRVQARVIGIKDGLLWRVDELSSVAVPFTNCVDRLSLSMQHGVEPADDSEIVRVRPISSWTW